MTINNNASQLPKNIAPPSASRPGIHQPATDNSPNKKGLGEIKSATSKTAHSDLSQFATWGGSGLSLGRLLGSTLRLPGRLIAKTGMEIEAAGAKINNKAGRFIVNNAGSGIKNLGNIIGAAAGITGNLVTLAERGVYNSLKGLAGIAVGGVGLATGLLSLGKMGESLRSTGATLIKEALMTRGEPAQKLTQEKAAQIKDLIALQRVAGSSKSRTLPEGFTTLEKSQIPERFQRYYKESSKPGENSRIETGRTTSALRVSVIKGPNDDIHVVFKGTDGKPGTWTADVLSLLGVADSSFRMARDLVSDLVAEHGAEKIHVQGHSLGGALAQFAGIKAGVASVTCFNAMGLTASLCDKLVDLKELGNSKLKQATHVEHFNSSSDLLSQGLQNRHLPFGLSQLGDRYDVAGGGRHGVPGMQAAIDNLSISDDSSIEKQSTRPLIKEELRSDSDE